MQGEIIPAVSFLSLKSVLNEVSTVLGQALLSGFSRIKVFVKFSAGTTGGTVVIESSDNENFTGNWHTEATVAWTVADKQVAVLLDGPFMFLRARISVAITGGGTASASAVTQR